MIRTQRASLQIGLKTYYIDSYTCRKIRFVSPRCCYSHVLVGRPAQRPQDPKSVSGLWGPSRCVWTGSPLERLLFVLRKPGSSKDGKVRWIWVGILTFPFSNVWSWMSYFSFLSLNFLIPKMGMITPSSQGSVRTRREPVFNGRHQLYRELENERCLEGVRAPSLCPSFSPCLMSWGEMASCATLTASTLSPELMGQCECDTQWLLNIDKPSDFLWKCVALRFLHSPRVLGGISMISFKIRINLGFSH